MKLLAMILWVRMCYRFGCALCWCWVDRIEASRRRRGEREQVRTLWRAGRVVK